MFSKKQKWVSKTSAKKTLQAYIKNEAFYDKTANASKLKKAIYVYILQPKVDREEGKFSLQIIGGLDLKLKWMLLKRPYETTNIWYDNLGPTKHKCLIELGSANSRPKNPYPMYKARHLNRSPTRK